MNQDHLTRLAMLIAEHKVYFAAPHGELCEIGRLVERHNARDIARTHESGTIPVRVMHELLRIKHDAELGRSHDRTRTAERQSTDPFGCIVVDDRSRLHWVIIHHADDVSDAHAQAVRFCLHDVGFERVRVILITRIAAATFEAFAEILTAASGLSVPGTRTHTIPPSQQQQDGEKK